MEIRDFDNGLNVDEVSDKMREGFNAEILREFFGRAEISKFLVPYRGNVNTIPLLDIKDKGKMIPIFSSYEAFEKSPLPKDAVNIVPFSKIDDIVKKSSGQIGGIVINPHGKSMIFQHNGDTAPKAPKMRFMKPAAVPESLIKALQNYFSECENVYAAYILWAQKEEELAPHIFLVIDFDGKKEEFFPKVAEAIRPCMRKGDSLEMAKADFKLLKASEKIVKPVYKKS